jgi:C-terminal processing protease CtpA/Prc
MKQKMLANSFTLNDYLEQFAMMKKMGGAQAMLSMPPGSGKLKVNDRLIRVTQENGESTDLIDMPVSQAVSFIRGEKGTKVTLEVLSGNSTAPVKISITRDKIKLTEGAA